MWTDLRACWALLTGVFLLMLANGLQASLLGIRATLEEFATRTTGLMMSGYFIGIFAGSLLSPYLVRRVGHIRVFGALASMASVTLLIHGLFVLPLTWFFMRVVTGICFAGLYVVAESWLNDLASNQTRGKILSIYMVVISIGIGGGQLLLNISSPEGLELFVLGSVVVSVGLIPVLLTARPAPAFEISTQMSLRELVRASPLASVGHILVGMTHGTIFGLGAVYAAQLGLEVHRVGWFMLAFMLGGMLFQWPIGFVSDRIERRYVICVVAGLSAVLCALNVWLPVGSWPWFGVTMLVGGLAYPLYPLCIAYVNDRLTPEQIVSASGSQVMLSGIGLSVGPILTAFLMDWFGNPMFFATMAAVLAVLCMFSVYRMGQRPGLSVEDQAPTLNPGQMGTPITELIAPDAEEYIEEVLSDQAETGEDEAADAESEPPKETPGGA